MSSRVKCDVEGLTLSIRQIGERATRGISKIMQEEGETIRDLARSYAPVDEGNLEEAIKMEVDRGGINRRIRVSVYVDMEMDASHGKTVGDYAMLMHEGLAPYGSGAYMLGPKSLMKAEGGADVGGKFMERAVDNRMKPMMDRVFAVVKGVL